MILSAELSPKLRGCFHFKLLTMVRDVTVTGVAVNPDINVDYNNYRFN